jgi:pimeloyl-ACP methyl ester carboxylesterase
METTKQVLVERTDPQEENKAKPDFKTSIRTERIDSLRVRYAERGKSNESKVLMIHGGGVSLGFLSWSKMIPALASEHHVYAPDMPGYGGSEKSSEKATLGYHVGFIERFMDHLKIEQANIVAESFGGGIAMSYALEHTERVKSLSLIDSYGFVEKHFPLGAYALTRINAGVQQLIIKNLAKSEKLFGKTLNFLLDGSEDAELNREKVQVVRDYVTRHNLTVSCLEFVQGEVTTRGLRTNFLKKIKEINRTGIPVLFIHGTNDPLFPIEKQRQAAEKIRNARFVPIDAAHQPEATHPNQVSNEILQFLRGAS